MRDHGDLAGLDPVDRERVDAFASEPILDELRRATTATARDASPSESAARGGGRGRRRYAVVAVAAAVALAAGLLVAARGGPGIGRPVTTAWHPGQAFSVPSRPAGHRAGTWRLLDDVLTGRWQQNTSGPPPGYLDCPSASACYAMSGHYSDARAGAALLGESLYVSTDVGATWTVYPMPAGFAPTSPLSCADATTCAAGGTYDGHAVLVRTTDGGHRFTIDPLPGGVGSLYALSCPAADACGGLAATSADGNGTPIDATLLTTADGGATFADHPIGSGDSMFLLDCAAALDCTAVGISDRLGAGDWTAGLAAATSDGGATWSVHALPAGFGVSYVSQLSCADAAHCVVTGFIAGTVANPPPCATLKLPSVPSAAATTVPPTGTVPSPAVRRISAGESQVATAENLRQASSDGEAGFSCTSSTHTLLGDIAATTDGGATWTPVAMPADVPQPVLSGLSCPSASECWASGEEAVPEQVGRVSNGGSPVLLGSTDGGTTWSKVTFSAPDGAPNYDGQSYLGMGLISCATASVCVALGAAAQGSPTAPVYRLVVPPPG